MRIWLRPTTSSSVRVAVVCLATAGLMQLGECIAQITPQPSKSGVPARTPAEPGRQSPDIQRELDNLVAKGRFADAFALARGLVAEAETAFGTNPITTAIALERLGQLYEGAGQPTNAQPVYARAFKIRSSTAGLEIPETLTTLHLLARIHLSMGDLPTAQQLYENCIGLREKVLGPEHPDTAKSLNNLGMLHGKLGNLDREEALYQRSLAIAEKKLGEAHPNTQLYAGNLANLHYRKREYPQAVALYQRVLAMREKALGTEHLDVAETLLDLGNVLLLQGESAKAEDAYSRCLAIREKTLGSKHSLTAMTLMNLGRVFRERGDYAKAEPQFQRAADIWVEKLGEEHVQTAAALNWLGYVQYERRDYASAERTLQRSLRVREKLLGAKHWETADTLHKLGMVYFTGREDYANAEPLFVRSLRIREEIQPDDPATAATLESLGGLYVCIWETAKAEPLLQRALKIQTRSLPANHPDLLRLLGTMGLLAYTKGDFAEAEARYRLVLDGLKKSLEPEHPSTAAPAILIAQVLIMKGDFAGAEPMLQRALTMINRVPNISHHSRSVPLANLAYVHLQLGNTANAERFLEQAVAQAEAVQAEPTGNLYGNLAVVKWKLGQSAASRELALKQKAKDTRMLANILSLASEQERLAYGSLQNPCTLFATLREAGELAEAVLRYKGVVLDSLLEDQLVTVAAKDPAIRSLADRLRTEGRKLMQLQLMGGAGGSTPELRAQLQAEQAKTQLEVDNLERELARKVTGIHRARRALSVKVAEVQAALPSGTVLMDFFEYADQLEPGKLQTRYGVVLIGGQDIAFKGGKPGEPIWLGLGKSAELEPELLRYSSLMRSGGRKEDEAVLRALHAQLFEPAQKLFPSGTRTLIVAPVAALNFLNFGTLANDDGSFVSEHFSIKYVAGGRDLLLASPKQADAQTLVAFGNPDFLKGKSTLGSPQVSDAPMPASIMSMRGDYGTMALHELPGTEQEVGFLKGNAIRWKLESQTFMGQAATEAQLAALRSPKILHLATHGFMLPQTPAEKALGTGSAEFGSQPNSVGLKNPMLRSGLALAGAKTTLEAWKRGEVPSIENDGILTAQEVGTLDLNGTWLVVLSACDTGLGESRNGEGVLGLRRGFVQAGAQNLLMTLWPISDKWSVEIMKAFYDKAMATGNAPQALAEVQAEWLGRLRKEKGAVIAARIAGPFVLTSRGKPIGK